MSKAPQYMQIPSNILVPLVLRDLEQVAPETQENDIAYFKVCDAWNGECDWDPAAWNIILKFWQVLQWMKG